MKFILRWLVRIIILAILFGNCIPTQASNMNWTVIKEDVKGQNFDVELEAAANEEGEYTKYGIKLWDDEGNLVYENSEGVFSPTTDLKVWYNLSGLQQGEEYSYQMYVIFDEECYYSPKGYFTI